MYQSLGKTINAKKNLKKQKQKKNKDSAVSRELTPETYIQRPGLLYTLYELKLARTQGGGGLRARPPPPPPKFCEIFNFPMVSWDFRQK